MKVMPLEAFRDKVSFVVAVDAVERGFRALALGEAVLPDPMVVELPAERAEVHVKGAHLKGARHIVLKVATGFYENRARGLPSGDGLFLLLDAKTGVPAVRDSRVIVTATASTTPLIMASWVAPGTHVTSVGTGSPEKIELEPALLARADKLVADRVFQTERYGNLHHAIAAGVIKRKQVYAELGDLAAGRRPGREQPDEITVADLTGVGVQDAAIAQAVVDALEL